MKIKPYLSEYRENFYDNALVLPYSDQVQWVAVGHTHMHCYNKEQWEIDAMLLSAKASARLFTRKFVQFFNGRKALNYPNHHRNPLIVSHLHMGKTFKTSSTIHYHFAFGNLPDAITQDDLFLIFAELWIKKANQSYKKLWLQKADDDNKAWIHYGHKEHRLNRHLGLDLNSTFLPSRLIN